MFCPTCGTTIQASQKFCTECGTALSGAAAPTQATPTFAPPSPPSPPGGTPFATGADNHPTPPAGNQVYDPTAALNVVEQTSPTGYDPNMWNADATGEWAPGVTGEAPVALAHPFKLTPLVVIADLVALLAIAAALFNFASVDVETDALGAATSTTLKLNDFSTNYLVGAVIGSVVLLLGAVLGATGRRVGIGLAGGAGLAIAGMMGMAVGQAIAFFDATEVALLGSGGSFTLTSTQEVGFWLAVAAAVLGAVAFALSLTSAGADGWPTLNPALGMLGALGTVAVVIGPLIPTNGASFGDNFSNDFLPPATLYLRLLVLVLIGIGGIVGFLSNRRWGIGLALGAISIGIWQTITAATESGDIPLGIAGGNYNGGSTDNPFAPHAVTIIGVAVMVLAGVAGLIIAAQQRNAR